METTFYDDPQFHIATADMRASIKRPATLNLDSPSETKKQRFSALLTSPDLNMLKLASPELERFIMAQQGTITTTPTPTQYLFPRSVTAEQEQYARGFVDALAQLHQTHPQSGEMIMITGPDTSVTVPCTSSSLASGGPTFQPLSSITRLYGGVALPVQVQGTSSALATSSHQATTSSTTSVTRPSSVDSSSSNSYPGTLNISSLPNVSVKEEPQTVPSDCSGITPPLSPINMENQERIKLERKRYRNRIAASKCRRRKLERIARLEEKVKDLKDENAGLGAVANKLREQVCQLKQEVLNHVKSGCQLLTVQSF